MKHLKILLLIIWTISVQSCDITKSALKQKESIKTNVDVVKTDSNKTIDFSTIATTQDEFNFVPADPSKFMQIVTAKGDTIKTKNTAIKRSKSTSKRNNNIASNTNNQVVDNSLLETETVLKASEKTEAFNSTWILYIVGGLVVIVCFAVVAALFTISKKLDKFIVK